MSRRGRGGLKVAPRSGGVAGNLSTGQLLKLDSLNQLAIRNLALYDSFSDELPQFDNLGATGFGLEDRYLFSADDQGFAQQSVGKREAGINRLNQRLQAHANAVTALEAKLDDGEVLTEIEEDQLEKSKEVLEVAAINSDILDIRLSDEENSEDLATTRAVLEESKENALEDSDPNAALANNIGATALALGTPQFDSDVEKAAAIRDTIQCWLSYNSPAFARHRMTNMPVDARGNINIPGYGSTSLVGVGDANKQRIALVNPTTLGYGLQNKLGYRNGTKEFTSILTHEYAQISPTLRIYKVYRDYQGDLGVKNTVEFEFNNNTRLDGVARELVSSKPNGKTYSTYTRGSEIGVKSFDWQFIGTDPFTATRDISATLKLHAQSLAVLFEKRVGNVIGLGDSSELGMKTYKYIDLLVQPDCKQEYSPECFEVRIDVGYAPLEGPTAGVRENLKSSIRAQKDILYLVLVDHSFDIAEDGSVDVTINFKGRLETLMKTRKANVLLPYGGALQEALVLDVADEDNKLTPVEIEDTITEIKDKKNISDADKERIKKLESALSDLSFKYKQIIHAHILDTMFKQKLIYTYDLNGSQKDIVNFNIFKKYQSKLSENQSLPPMIDDAQIAAQLRTSTSRPATGDPVLSSDDVDEVTDAADTDLANLSLQSQRKVEFFYFGDLIAIVLQSVVGENTAVGSITTESKYWGLSSTKPKIELDSSKSKPSDIVQQLFNKFRVIFGNVEVDSGFSPSIDGTNNRINLAHMPISLEAYSAFYRNKILSSNTAEYPFFDFVDDVLTELVLDPLSSRCFNGLFDISFRPKTTTMVVPNTINKDYYGRAAAAAGAVYLPLPDALPYNAINLSNVPQNTQIFGFDMDSEAISSLSEYLVIGAEVQDLDILKGCESDDLKIGIVHLHFGNAQGMMKKVSFQKSDIEYLPELRYASEGNFLYNQLANVYDCSIDLIGNNLFKPGMYVYINTSALGAGETFERTDTTLDRSWANLMGLGGYHLVTEVAHSISRDGFNTTLKARWVASGQRSPGENCPDLA